MLSKSICLFVSVALIYIILDKENIHFFNLSHQKYQMCTIYQFHPSESDKVFYIGNISDLNTSLRGGLQCAMVVAAWRTIIIWAWQWPILSPWQCSHDLGSLVYNILHSLILNSYTSTVPGFFFCRNLYAIYVYIWTHRYYVQWN